MRDHGLHGHGIAVEQWAGGVPILEPPDPTTSPPVCCVFALWRFISVLTFRSERVHAPPAKRGGQVVINRLAPGTKMAKATPEAIIGRRSAKRARGGIEPNHVHKSVRRITAHNVPVDSTRPTQRADYCRTRRKMEEERPLLTACWKWAEK